MKQIKLVFFSDSHLGFDYPVRPRKAKPRRGPDFFNNFNIVLNSAIDSGADIVIHGGDLFFRTLLPKQIVHKVYESLNDFAESGIPILIVPGNHESSKLPESLFLNHKNIFVFDRLRSFSFNINDIKLRISGFPYYKNNVRDNFPVFMEEEKKDCDKADYNILCFHHSVQGSTCGPGNFTFKKGEDVIQIKDLPEEYNLFLSGHIHRHQELSFRKNNRLYQVLYAGSIERTSFAEIEETKGYYKIMLEMTKNNNILMRKGFVPLPAREMFLLDIDYEADNSDALAKYLENNTKNIKPGSIVRVRCNNDKVKKLINVNYLKNFIPENCYLEYSGFGKFNGMKNEKRADKERS